MIIIGIILIIFFIQVFKLFKKSRSMINNIKKLVDSDPAYETERRVRDRIEKIKFGTVGTFKHEYSTKQYYGKSHYDEYLEHNQQKCVEFLKDGALMVCTYNIIDPHDNFNHSQSLYVYTHRATFRRTKEDAGFELNDIFPSKYKFGMGNYRPATVVNKKSSVAGSALAGGVIAGAPGAIVGALHSTEKNASGGTDKIHFSNDKVYYTALDTHQIDCIFISKDILKHYAPPPSEYISVETDDYWILRRYLSSYNDSQNVKDLLAYLNGIVDDVLLPTAKES